MANILGVSAFGTGITPKYWWEWTLVAIIGASGLVGLITFIWGLYKTIHKLYKVSFIRQRCLFSRANDKAYRGNKSLRFCHGPCKNIFIFYLRLLLSFDLIKTYPRSLHRLACILDH